MSVTAFDATSSRNGSVALAAGRAQRQDNGNEAARRQAEEPMDTWTDCAVRYANHRERVTRIEHDDWRWRHPMPDAGSPTARANPALIRCLQERVHVLVTGAFRSLPGAHGVVHPVATALAHDSRDVLRSEQGELAAHGMRWGRSRE